jgi:hypothetical protein
VVAVVAVVAVVGKAGAPVASTAWSRPKGVPACGPQGVADYDKDTGRLRHDEARTATETAVAPKRQLRSENSPSEPASFCQPIEHTAPVAVIEVASPPGSTAM